jgi:hypothetical protein
MIRALQDRLLSKRKHFFPVAIKKAREETIREQEEQEEIRRREKAKQKRKEEEDEEIRKREKELADIMAAQKLAAARNKESNEDRASPASFSRPMDLPATKHYAAFISHKKAHSKHGDSSSTLARSLKVRYNTVSVHVRYGFTSMIDRTC